MTCKRCISYQGSCLCSTCINLTKETGHMLCRCLIHDKCYFKNYGCELYKKDWVRSLKLGVKNEM